MTEKEIDNLASAISKVSLESENSKNTNDAWPVCSNIKIIFKSLKDTKLKKKAIKLLEQNYKLFPSETQHAVRERIKKDTKDGHGKHVLMKQVLDLMDGTPSTKKIIEPELQEISLIVSETLRDFCYEHEKDNRCVKEANKVVLDSEIFNSLKMTVSIFQKYGDQLIHRIFEADVSATWQASWIQELISKLITVLRNKMLHKEILSLAGTALAHIVNTLPSSVLSLQLCRLILGNAGTDEVREMSIGPLLIYIASCNEDISMLSEIMAYNGLLSVCQPLVLLADISIGKKTETLLLLALSKILEACSNNAYSSFKYSSFLVLNNWMECASRITMSVYHCQAEKREPLFQEASQCCSQLLAIIWDNREDMIDGVPKSVLSIFKELIELHQSERIFLQIQGQDSQLFDTILRRLLKDPWYVKGRYTLLCELLPHFGIQEILQPHPSLPLEISKCYGTSTLPAAANECYRVLLKCAKASLSSEKLSLVSHWKSIWCDIFLSLLKHDNVRSVHNSILYFIPTTLQLVDGVYEVLRDTTLQALKETGYVADDKHQEASSTRSNIVFGYCSIFKLGRKLGLASVSDIDADILKEGLWHVNDDVRAAAVSVLCYNGKTTEPITELEETLILEFLSVNLNCASSSFRQSLFVSLKVFLARIRDSSIVLLRNYKKESGKNSEKEGALNILHRLLASIDLVKNIVSLSLRNLFPGASFQRRKTALLIFCSVLETFSSPEEAVKRGRTAQSLQLLTSWISEREKWKFLTFKNFKMIIACFEDQHDEIRELSMKISRWFDFEKMKICDEEKNQLAKELFSQARKLMSSPKIRDAESGAILMEFIAERFSLPFDVLISNAETTQLNSSQSLATIGNCHTNIVEAVRFLIETLQRDMRASELDILDSAVNRPVFGYTLAARRCFNALIDGVKACDSEENLSEELVETLVQLTNDAVKTCIFVIQTALSIFSKQTEEATEQPQDTSPSFADMNEALGRKLRSCKSFPMLKEKMGYQHCLEVLSSFCWLNVKAASLFLGEVAKIWSLGFLSLVQRKMIFPDELIQITGRMFKETLINCRHKGVIENSYSGFQKFCKYLSSSSSNVEILNNWLHKVIDACGKNDMSSSITKRSAGLPMYVQSIISSCLSSPDFSLTRYMKWLIEIAKRPVPCTGRIETDLPQVQSINILRGIYRDSSVGTEVLKFAEDGVMLAVDGFASSSWSIRNAAQILLGALVPRMLGQKVTQAEKSHHNSVSPDQFFSRYPSLENFFLSHLRTGVDCKNRVVLLPALVPILTFLSKLRPCENQRFSSLFSPLLDNLLSSPVVTVRNLASSCLTVFISRNSMLPFTCKTISDVISSDSTTNYKHGLLLVIKKLLSMLEDDDELRDEILTKAVFPQLDALFCCNQDKRVEYLTRSTLFEILSVIVTYLPELPVEFAVKYRDRISAILQQHLTNFGSNDKVCDHRRVGNCLYLKRFTASFLDFLLYLQHHNVEKTCSLLDGLLSLRYTELEVELLETLQSHLNLGKFLHSELKTRIRTALVRNLLSDYSEHDFTVYWNCWCSIRVKDKTLDDDVVYQLFRTSSNISSSCCSYRVLAATLPFIASLLGPVCEAILDKSCHEDFMSLLIGWSEKIYASSFANEREILRVSSLNAIQACFKNVMLLYRNGDCNHLIEMVCVRIIFALLTLLQDEDEAIRKQAGCVSSSLTPDIHSNLQPPLQANLALKAVFDFISTQHEKNTFLLKELFLIIEEVYRNNELNSSIQEDRSVLLFEQEGSNLFSEEFVLVSEIIHCLTRWYENNAQVFTNESKENPDEVESVLSRIKKDHVVVLQTLVDAVKRGSCECGKSFFGISGSSRAFLALYTCIRLSGFFIKLESTSLQERDDIYEILKCLNRVNCHPILLEEISKTTNLINKSA